MPDLKSVQNALPSKKISINDLLKGQDEARKGIVRQKPFTLPVDEIGADTTTQDGLFRIPNVNYYLELREANKDVPLVVIGFPFDPGAIQIDTPQNMLITHALNTTYREVAENNNRTITIQGQSGYAPRLGFARDGGYCFEGGEVLMEEFEEFLNNYNYLLYKYSSSIFNNFTGKGNTYSSGSHGNVIHSGYKKIVNASGKFFLTLRCVRENIRYKVEPLQFMIGKDSARNKFGYQYTLQLLAYGIYGEGRRSNILKDVMENIAGAIKYVALMAAFIEGLILNVNEDYINPIRGPINALNQSVTQIENIVTTFGAVTNNALNLIVEARQSLNKVANIINPKGRVARDLSAQMNNTVSNYENVVFDSQVFSLRNQNTQNAFKNNQLPNNEYSLNDLANEAQLPQPSGLRVRQNASVQEINNLNKVLEMLTELDYTQQPEDKLNDLAILRASLNSLDYYLQNLFSLIPLDFEPNQIDTTQQGFERINFRNLNNDNDGLFTVYTLAEGENLNSVARKFLGQVSGVNQLVEFNGFLDAQRRGDGTLCDAGDLIKIPTNNINLLFNNDGLGVDISIPEFEAAVAVGQNDIRLERGLDNIRQAIKNVLLTHAGELGTALRFGLGSILGAKNLEYIKTVVIEKILADERLSRVQILNIRIEEDTLILNLLIDTINNQQLNINTAINI